MNASTPTTLTMTEVMETLKFSRATLYKIINSGDLRTYKVGKRRYCTPDAVRDLQKSLEQETAA